MSFADCCDVYCTSCRICYLKLLKPGDTVPFKRPKYILALGGIGCLLAVVVIVLNILAIYAQAMGVTSPPPSFLGIPGTSIWLSIVVISSGCSNIAAHKKKTRFSTAIAFGFSATATLVTIALLAVLTMAICEEQRKESPTGIVIAAILCIIAFVLFFIVSLSALSTYMALTSHDQRWFTDRGVQSDCQTSTRGNEQIATLSVPSTNPAFLFYAPSAEAKQYSNAFQHVIEKLEINDENNKERNDCQENMYNHSTDERNTADLTDGEETYVMTPASMTRQKVVNDAYSSLTPTV